MFNKEQIEAYLKTGCQGCTEGKMPHTCCQVDESTTSAIIRQLLNRVEELEKDREFTNKVKELLMDVIREVCWGYYEPDGGSLQDKAVKMGILRPDVVKEGDPECEDEESDFDVGTEIYRFTDQMLKGVDDE